MTLPVLSTVCTEYSLRSRVVDWYTAAQAVASVGVVMAFVGVVVLVWWMCSDRCSLWVKVIVLLKILGTREYMYHARSVLSRRYV